MDNSSVATNGSLLNDSLIVLFQIYPASIAWVICGTMSIVSNSMLIVMLGLSKRETTCFRQNIFYLAVTDFMIGVSLTFSGSKRLYLLMTGISEVSAPWECGIELTFMNIAIVTSIMQIFCIAVDRFVAVIWPVYYHKQMNLKKLKYLSLSLWLLTMVLIGSGLKFLVAKPWITNCTSSNTFSSLYNLLFLTPTASMVALTLVIYVAILSVVKRRISRISSEKGDVEDAKKEMETNVLNSVVTISTFYFFTVLCTSLGAQIVVFICGPTKAKFITPYLTTAAGITSGSSLFIYLWQNESLRREFVTFYFRKRAGVSTVTTQNQFTVNDCRITELESKEKATVAMSF